MKLIVSLSSGKGVGAFQTSPQVVMLKLVEKYSHFVSLPKMHTSETNGDTTGATSGEVLRITYISTLIRSIHRCCHLIIGLF